MKKTCIKVKDDSLLLQIAKFTGEVGWMPSHATVLKEIKTKILVEKAIVLTVTTNNGEKFAIIPGDQHFMVSRFNVSLWYISQN